MKLYSSICLLAFFALMSATGCSVVRSSGEAVESVGSGVGNAIVGTGSAIGNGAEAVIGGTGEAVQRGANRVERKGY